MQFHDTKIYLCKESEAGTDMYDIAALEFKSGFLLIHGNRSK